MGEEYAGWANWETWVTNLWASNYEPFYKEVVALTRAGKVEEAIDRTISYAARHERKLDTTKINREELKEAFLEMSGLGESEQPEASAPGEGRKYLTGHKWELIGYSWRQNIVTDKWDAMRVFGDGSSDPAEIESYESREEAHTAAEQLAMKKNVPVFPPEHPHTVFFIA